MATGDTAKTFIGNIVGAVTWPLFFIGGFVGEWWASRNWRWFFVSIPALVIGGAVTIGFVRAHWASDSGLAGSYAKQAVAAYKADDQRRAEMLYRKAIKYRPTDPTLKFARAFVLDKMDRTEEASVVMQSIAPIGAEAAEGYNDAHMWLATALLTQHVKVEGNALALAQAHLNAIFKTSPEHPEAHRLFTDLALSMRNGPMAVKHIQYIVDKYPQTRVIYARLLLSAKRFDEARQEATKASDYYLVLLQTQAAAETETAKAGDYLNWASAKVVLAQTEEDPAAANRQFNTAIAILNDARQACEQQKLIRQGEAGILVAWASHLDQVDPTSVRRQLELLGKAMRVAPDNPDVLKRVAMMIGRDSTADPIAENMLQDALVNGTAPAMVHFLLGTRAAAKDADSKIAQSHLEQALIRNPNIPVALNNLAWVIGGRGDPESLASAMKLADKAVKLLPHQENFRETRGQLHIKLENWRDGIADLEAALRKLKNRPEIHKSLALAYKEIGDPTMAAGHQAKYDQIAKAEGLDKAKTGIGQTLQ